MPKNDINIKVQSLKTEEKITKNVILTIICKHLAFARNYFYARRPNVLIMSHPTDQYNDSGAAPP